MFILSVTLATSSLEGTEDLADAVEKKQRRYKKQGAGSGKGAGSVLILDFSCSHTSHLTHLGTQHHCLPDQEG